jgi:hypothetical protein
MKPENVAGLFMLVILASAASIVLAHFDFCTWLDGNRFCGHVTDKVEPNGMQEDLLMAVAELRREQAEANACFEKAISIIHALKSAGAWALLVVRVCMSAHVLVFVWVSAIPVSVCVCVDPCECVCTRVACQHFDVRA